MVHTQLLAFAFLFDLTPCGMGRANSQPIFQASGDRLSVEHTRMINRCVPN
jgi:hypothetical protein